MKLSRTLLLLTIGAATLGACDPQRIRPGPPRIDIEIPNNGDVLSPDTIVIRVTAVDNDGLDSLVVRYLGNVIDVNTGFNVESSAEIQLTVPGGLPVGTNLTVAARAIDLKGQATDESAELRVIAVQP
ncbi:MAG: hypothetical protein ACE5FJ_11345 [Gemmatimonadales bacterium]